MGARQMAEIWKAANEVYEAAGGAGDEPSALCTVEAVTASGDEIWVQLMPGTVNLSYPFTDEPTALLRARGVRLPEDAYLVEWVAGQHATFGFGHIGARDHAFLADQLFVRVLGCDDESYEPRPSVESL